MFGMEKIKQWLRNSDGSEEPSDLSPSCRKLLDFYHLSGEEHEGEVLALGIYPKTECVVVFFYASVLRSHPAFSFKDYADRNIKVTFSGAAKVHAALNGQALPNDELCDMSLGSIDALEIKGNCAYGSNTLDYHIHTLHLESAELVVGFAFDDLTFEEEPYFRPSS